MRHFERHTDYLQHWLFRAIRKTVMEQNGWRCQICNALATEVHHKQYPQPWGTFDVPANLQPICHACHCRIEGKTS